MTKKVTSKNEPINVPATLADHPFYGIELDEEQKIFRDAIWNVNKDIIFCNSKAGTGKTLVAVGTANLLVQYKLYEKIIYVLVETINIMNTIDDPAAQLEEYKKKVQDLEHQLQAQQTPSSLVNYGTVNIYEK